MIKIKKLFLLYILCFNLQKQKAVSVFFTNSLFVNQSFQDQFLKKNDQQTIKNVTKYFLETNHIYRFMKDKLFKEKELSEIEKLMLENKKLKMENKNLNIKNKKLKMENKILQIRNEFWRNTFFIFKNYVTFKEFMNNQTEQILDFNNFFKKNYKF